MNETVGVPIARSSGLAWLREHREQLALSLRVTVAAVLSFALSRAVQMPLSLWTVLTAVILTQATFGSSVKATLDYLMSTLCGSMYAGAISVLIPHESALAQAGVLALAVAPLALLAVLRPSFNAATFTGVLVLLIPQIAHVGPIESAMYRVIEVALGAVTALLVSVVVLPTRAFTLVADAAARTLDLMAQALSELTVALSEARDEAMMRRLQDRIGEAFAQLEPLVVHAGQERIGLFAAEPDPGPLRRTILRLRHDFVILGRAAMVPLPESLRSRLGPGLARIATAVTCALRDMSAALVARRAPPNLDFVVRSLDDFAELLAAVRRDGLTVSLPTEAVERIFALGLALDQMRQNLLDLDRCVRDAARRG